VVARRGGRSAVLAPLLLFAGILLVAALAFNLANLEPGSDGTPGLPPTGSDPLGLGISIDPRALGPVISVAAAAFLVLLIVAIFKGRQRRPQEPMQRSMWMWIIVLANFVVVLLLLSLWPDIASRGDSGATPGTTEPPSGENLPAWPTLTGAPAGLFLLAVLLANVVLVVILARGSPSFRALGRHRAELPSPAPRAEAAEAVKEAIGEIEIGGDVRTAILACFQRFCRLLGQRGIAEQAPLTAREIEDAAVHGLGVSQDHATTLTSLFEEARYSVHDLGERERVLALRSLEAIRGALEA